MRTTTRVLAMFMIIVTSVVRHMGVWWSRNLELGSSRALGVSDTVG